MVGKAQKSPDYVQITNNHKEYNTLKKVNTKMEKKKRFEGEGVT